jgi:hypothetical protein
MDPTGLTHIASQAQRLELPPAQPDAAHVQQFQEIYWQEPQQTQNLMPGMTMEALSLVDNPNGSFFIKAMENMVQMHEHGCARMESLVDHFTGGMAVSPAEMLKAQAAMHDVTLSLQIYQSFDKKLEEGVKTLMTGQ